MQAGSELSGGLGNMGRLTVDEEFEHSTSCEYDAQGEKQGVNDEGESNNRKDMLGADCILWCLRCN